MYVSCISSFSSSSGDKKTARILFVVLLLIPTSWLAAASSSTISASSSPPSSLPRSKASRHWAVANTDDSSSSSFSNTYYPPWNASPRIKYNGFLKDEFRRIPGEWEPEVRLRTRQRLDTRCRIRQVPGDGNCLFHSISLCLQHAVNGTHVDLSTNAGLHELYRHSQRLRQQAVDCLRQPHKRLFLQGREVLQSGELVQAAAQQYGLSSQEYCAAMEQDCVWGGGPEIVALCNLLQRPIHVYELACAAMTNDNDKNNNNNRQTFVLRRMACFGSPRFDRNEALHILSADSRFPDVPVGQQLAAGNHFLAVFAMQPAQRRRIRGGCIKRHNNKNKNNDKDDDDNYENWIDWEAEAKPFSLWQWWKDLLQ